MAPICISGRSAPRHSGRLFGADMRTLKYLALVFWLTASAAETDDNIAGVGVVLGVDGQHIIIRKILPDSPAASQPDVHVGDRITAIAQHKKAAVQVQNGDLRR